MASPTKIYFLLCLILLLSITGASPGNESQKRIGIPKNGKPRASDPVTGSGEKAIPTGKMVAPSGRDDISTGKMEAPSGTLSAPKADCVKNISGFAQCSGTSVNGVPQDLTEDIVGLGFYRTSVIPMQLADGAFQRYTKLGVISFRYAPIDSIAKAAFRGLPKLLTLSIYESKLNDSHFENKNFVLLSTLKKLSLDNVHLLTKLPSDLLRSTPNLEYLSITYCPRLDQINSEALQYVQNLKTLHLPWNNIIQLDSSVFKHVPNLIKLDLSDNRSLKQISPSAFTVLQNLEEISLRQCKLTALDGAAFMSSRKLKKLDISHNAFDCDCKAEWMARAMVDGKGWAVDWSEPASPSCVVSKTEFYWITKLLPQDLTCDAPHVEAITPVYVERQPETTLYLKAHVTKGFPESTWVLPDGTTRKAMRFADPNKDVFIQGDRVVGEVSDMISRTDHSVEAWCEIISEYNGTGITHFTLMASNIAGRTTNVTFNVHTTAGAVGGPPVYSSILFVWLISYLIFITG